MLDACLDKFSFQLLSLLPAGYLTSTSPAPGHQLPCCQLCGARTSLRSRMGRCVHKYDHFCWFLSTIIGKWRPQVQADRRVRTSAVKLQSCSASPWVNCAATPLHSRQCQLFHINVLCAQYALLHAVGILQVTATMPSSGLTWHCNLS